MQKELDYMIEKFPKHRALVTELYYQNEDFKSLCEDFWECQFNISMLMEKEIKEPRIENGYKMLSLSLEQEVLTYLHK